MNTLLSAFFILGLHVYSLQAQDKQLHTQETELEESSEKGDVVEIDKNALLNFSIAFEQENEKVLSFKVKIKDHATILNKGNRFNAKTQSLIKLAEVGTEVLIFDIEYKTEVFDKPLTFILK